MEGSQPVVVVTTTKFDRPSVRSGLAIEMMSKALDNGLAVVDIDDQSHAEFREKAVSLGATLIQQRYTGHLSSDHARVEAIAIAHDFDRRATLVWLEPEKAEMIDKILPATAGLTNTELGLFYRKDLSGYSREQTDMYAEGRTLGAELLGRDIDLFFGPMLMGSEVATHFTDGSWETPIPRRWAAIHTPRFKALALDVTVRQFIIDYRHPPLQTAGEQNDTQFADKRSRQKTELSAAYSDAFNYWGLATSSLENLKHPLHARTPQ
jgi:hypothetical protein